MKVPIVLLGLVLSLTFATPVRAVSGACSWHGGVNCSVGSDSDGSIICSDGWRGSSVSYSDQCGGSAPYYYEMPLNPEIWTLAEKLTDNLYVLKNSDGNISGIKLAGACWFLPTYYKNGTGVWTGIINGQGRVYLDTDKSFAAGCKTEIVGSSFMRSYQVADNNNKVSRAIVYWPGMSSGSGGGNYLVTYDSSCSISNATQGMIVYSVNDGLGNGEQAYFNGQVCKIAQPIQIQSSQFPVTINGITYPTYTQSAIDENKRWCAGLPHASFKDNQCWCEPGYEFNDQLHTCQLNQSTEPQSTASESLQNSTTILKITPDPKVVTATKGRLLLQVEDGGRIWYVSPTNGERYEVTFANALPLFQKLSLGVANTDLSRIAESSETRLGDTALASKLKGKLLLQVQDGGRIWYVNPLTLKRHEVTWANLMDLFRSLSLGVSNDNLNKLQIGVVN